jgi:hypothetical protein
MHDLHTFEDVFGKVWMLFLLRSAEQQGLAPIPSPRLHRLLYFSNCLYAVYGQAPPVEYVLKHRRGPFYPRAQWDLDRLSTMGLVDVSRLRFEDRWPTAIYQISRLGLQMHSRLADELRTCKLMSAYLGDVARSFAVPDDSNRDDVVERDANYGRAGIDEGSVIAFTRHATNRALLATEQIRDTAPPLFQPSASQRLKLYMKCLELLAA